MSNDRMENILDTMNDDEITIEDAIVLLSRMRDDARRAGGSTSLTRPKRQEARDLADALSDEVKRLSFLSLGSRSNIYLDTAEALRNAVQPLRDVKKAIEKIVTDVQAARTSIRVLDKLLSVAARLA